MDLPGKDIYGVGLDTSIRKLQMDFRQYVAKSKGGLSLAKLKQIFNQFDQNGNGLLEPDEFEQCLAAFGIFLKKYEYQLIFNFYDADKNGKIEFNEFLEGIRMPLNKRRQDFVTKIFNILDRDGSGQITREDMNNRISFQKHPQVVSGLVSEDQMMDNFLHQFENGSVDGKITLQEFIDYYQDVSLGIPNDEYFIQLLEEQWLTTENDNAQVASDECNRIVTELREKLIKLSAGNKDDVIINKVFQQYDINHDSFLGLDEFQLLLRKQGIPYNSKYVSLAFNKIDTNHSGFIEFNEFFSYIVHGIQN